MNKNEVSLPEEQIKYVVEQVNILKGRLRLSNNNFLLMSD